MRSNLPLGASPSTVVIRDPTPWQAGIRQEFTSLSSTMTEQAPHSPSPQPSLVPVSLRSSRSTSSKRFMGGTSTLRAMPLTSNSIFIAKSTQSRRQNPGDQVLSSAAINRSGVIGISLINAPVALKTAAAIAGAGPSIGSSPTPLAPKGPWGYGFSIINDSMSGASSEVGIM